MARLDDAAVEEGLQRPPGWERRGNENLPLSGLAEGGLPARDLPFAGRIPELGQPRRPPDGPGAPGGVVVARENRDQFTGWIAGFGTDSGCRVVIGHWHASPYGTVTDVMAEDPAGHRTLYAPTPQLGAFLATVYSFHDVQVARCNAWRSGRCWRVEAGPLRAWFTIGRRNLLGWLLWAMPAALARTVWWVDLLDLPARRLLPGVRTRGRTRDGRRQWYSAQDLHPIIAAEAVVDGLDLGALRAVRPPVGFGFGSVPGRPSLVHLTTMIETVPGGDGDEAA